MYGINEYVTSPTRPPQTEAACQANLAPPFAESSQANFASHIYQAAAHLAQPKLFLRRAMRAKPGACIKTRRVLETLAVIQQAAIESARGLAVAE